MQSQWTGGFAERLFIGHQRVRERFGGPVCSLAVLADASPTWRPDRYVWQAFGCRLEFSFPVAKLADYRERLDELDQSSNPFAVIVAAHLFTQSTQKDPHLRLQHKLQLVRSLYRRNFSRLDIVRLFRLVDWLLHLESPQALQFAEKLAEYEEEDKMPYVSMIEQAGIDKGLQLGLQQGLALGINRILTSRFGPIPAQVAAALSRLDTAQLEELTVLAASVPSLEVFRAVLPGGP